MEVNLINIRDFADNKHRRVDDRPFGGGPGMVMMPQPLTTAINSVKKEGSHLVYLSPQGAVFNAAKARELATRKHLVLLCGHYEGVDERIIETLVDEEISIGDYVLTNGCLAAIVLIDALMRFVPKVLGHSEAANEDSFENGLLDCPHYTRPELFEGLAVPEILLSGDHRKIAAWRHAKAVEKTRRMRPDLLQYLEE